MLTSRTSMAVPGTLEPNRTVTPSSGCTRITIAFWPSSSVSVLVKGRCGARWNRSAISGILLEGHRLFHRDEREQLQQVILDHVARGADSVVVPRPAADADVLGHGDLNVVHVAAV